ncbi:Lrp/AsnC family transcriptional regulator [Paracoccus sp. MC1854]|uniref:Lrp/AsnC family transcriptional regulator n=1 Tax=Paracoccus sp. MC1854 TaxID=2760306 RepID=UPI001600A74E|nr:Lrp/AsnC family transcriptional regulator [Paracoccus sp. MC1854]
MTSAQLDSFEIRILRLLRENGRMPVQDISERVGLSPTPVARRIRALESRGVITGYTALIDEAALGYGITVFVSVQLDRQIDRALEQFESAIRSFPEVVDCWLMTGSRDYLLRIVTESLATYETFLTARLTRVPGVSNIESSIPIRRVKSGIARTP